MLILIGFLLNILTFLFFLVIMEGTRASADRIKKNSIIFAVAVLIPYCFTFIFIVWHINCTYKSNN